MASEQEATKHSPTELTAFERVIEGYKAADPRGVGEGGGPTRASILPADAAGRKKFPIGGGVLDYFPDAIAAVAHVSYRGNEQHNPGKSLRWTRGLSTDEADTMMRHYEQRGSLDVDGIPHSWKMAWRALALVQKEIEEMLARATPKQTRS